MITTIVSSLINSKKRRTVLQVFSPSLKKLWKDWELRVLVLVSLGLQIVLIFLGNRRKYINKLWIRIVVWSAYLSADSIATVALGVISNNLNDDAGCEDLGTNNTELTAFWAPFLLLHLGGPDTITAYALEDNELWLRHFLGLIIQTGIAVYIFLMAWTGSYLSILSMPMLSAGIIKYGERTWALWSTSLEKLTENSVPDQYSHPNGEADDLFSRDHGINEEEGYCMGTDMITEVEVQADVGSIFDEDKLFTADRFINITRRLFLDSALSSRERDAMHTVFRSISFGKAFEVTEIQLGFMYDLFYTKSPLPCTYWGLGLRFNTFFLTCLVLLFFSFLNHKHKYSNVDLSITFTLLVGAIILEIYSGMVLLSSDRFAIWLAHHSQKASNLQLHPSFPRQFKSPRWSNKMPQFSVLSFCMEEKPLPRHRILKHLPINEKIEKQWHVRYDEKVPEDLKKLIFRFVQIKALKDETPFAAIDTANAKPIDDSTRDEFQTSLGQFILVTHIATEVLYYRHEDKFGNNDALHKHGKLIKGLSHYMMYLLINYPSMLSADEILRTIINETVSDITKVLKNTKGLSKAEAYSKLMNPNLDSGNQDEESATPSALSVLSFLSGCPEDLGPKTEEELLGMWEQISVYWLEVLVYAAGRCKGNNHAQQLRRGGELLTHVWLLLAHFGLTDHFQILEPQRIGRLIRK